MSENNMGKPEVEIVEKSDGLSDRERLSGFVKQKEAAWGRVFLEYDGVFLGANKDQLGQACEELTEFLTVTEDKNKQILEKASKAQESLEWANTEVRRKMVEEMWLKAQEEYMDLLLGEDKEEVGIMRRTVRLGKKIDKNDTGLVGIAAKVAEKRSWQDGWNFDIELLEKLGEMVGAVDSGDENREEVDGADELREAIDMREKLPNEKEVLWSKVYGVVEDTLSAKRGRKLLDDEAVFQKIGLLEGGFGGFSFPEKIMKVGKELSDSEYRQEVAKIKAFVSARRKLHDALLDIKSDIPYADWLNSLKAATASSPQSLVTFEVDKTNGVNDYLAFAEAEFGSFTKQAKNEAARLFIGVLDLARVNYERSILTKKGVGATDIEFDNLRDREQVAENTADALGLDKDYLIDIGKAGFDPRKLKKAVQRHRLNERGIEREIGEMTTDLVWDFLEAHQWRIWGGGSPFGSASDFGNWGDEKHIPIATMLHQERKWLDEVLPGIMKPGMENMVVENKNGYQLAMEGRLFDALSIGEAEKRLNSSPMFQSIVQALDGEGVRALYLIDLPGGKGIAKQGENLGQWVGWNIKINALKNDGVYSEDQAKEILMKGLDFATWLISWDNEQYRNNSDLVARAKMMRLLMQELDGGGFLGENFDKIERAELINKADKRRRKLLWLVMNSNDPNLRREKPDAAIENQTEMMKTQLVSPVLEKISKSQEASADRLQRFLWGNKSKI